MTERARRCAGESWHSETRGLTVSDDLTYYQGREADMANALESVFGDDFASMDGAMRLTLIEDCYGIAAEEDYDGGFSADSLAREYRDRIGAKNLPSYAACFRITGQSFKRAASGCTSGAGRQGTVA